MTGLLLHLYPASWRSRYGEEFAALLEERPMGPFDVADVVLGAIDARLHLGGRQTNSQPAKGLAMTLRIGGYAAILGSLLWVVGLAAASSDESEANSLWGLVILAGNAALLVALVGLSAFQARRYPRLVWAAFAVPFVGTLLSMFGILSLALNWNAPFVGGLSPWEVWITGLFALVAGSGLFAFASWRTGSLSRAGAGLLALGAIVLVLSIPEMMGLYAWEPLVSIGMPVMLVAFVGGWEIVGIGAVRSDRISLAGLPG
jgi:hypothetical protein